MDDAPNHQQGAGVRRFPDGFVWGVATSAYQIEGAWDADEKGPSIWDTFAHVPGNVAGSQNGDVAADHYHRYREDVGLLSSLGAMAYRFSISWPRIFPEGTGRPNPEGLDFYQRLVDELLAAGIRPFATLYHWDLPQALEDRFGGWRSKATAEAFADYAGFVAEHLSDRVHDFVTVNELHTFVDLGYQGTEADAGDGRRAWRSFAPGVRLDNAGLNQVRHHGVLAHGMATQAIRAQGKLDTAVGFAENLDVAVPVVETPECIDAAERATRDGNAPFLTVMLEGRYLDGYLEWAGDAAPRFTDEELATIATPVDFVGINVYKPTTYVAPSDEPPGYRRVPFSASHPRMLAPWHEVGPEALYWAARHVHTLWRPASIYVTENGCAASDVVDTHGRIDDTDRMMFLRACLTELQRATTEGVPVHGYFVWSALDNFEWTDGYGMRFGLVHVDFDTLKRTPKLSADWFREAARRNAVV